MILLEFTPDVPVARPGNSLPAGDDEHVAKLARAMCRALKRAADYAMRHDDAAAAANEALARLRAEFLWRFELLRSRKRLPDLIIPDPLPPAAGINCQSNA